MAKKTQFEPPHTATIGCRLRRLRKERKLTQAELARQIGIQQSDLSRMEQGEYRVSLDNLFKILGVFDLQIAEFFAEYPAASQAMQRPLSHGDMQVLHLLRQLSPEARQEVQAFIEFKLRRERIEQRALETRRAKNGTEVMKERCEELLRQAQVALEHSELEEAHRLASAAELLAAEYGDEELSDRAFCNACAFAIELGQAADQVPRLKQILLRSSNPRNRFLAAYYSAVAYDLEDDPARAVSYAQRANELAGGLDEPELTARSANLAGNLALRGSDFTEAEDCYGKALDAHRGLDGYHRLMEAQEMDNMGYVLMCTDRVDEGIALCEEARSTLEAMEDEHYLPQNLQDLCYGYLLVDDLDRAHTLGERALDLAVGVPDPLVVKNCLFLLSEVAVRRGDTFRARRYLRELTTHYPEVGVSEEIIDVFLATDLTTVVNLRG